METKKITLEFTETELTFIKNAINARLVSLESGTDEFINSDLIDFYVSCYTELLDKILCHEN